MNTQHTPGPWHVVDGTFDTMIADPNCKFVAEVTQTGMGYAVAPNARLIAAAPELLRLLLEARSLGLRFDCGTAYIRRAYIDQQEALNAQIDAIVSATKGA